MYIFDPCVMNDLTESDNDICIPTALVALPVNHLIPFLKHLYSTSLGRPTVDAHATTTAIKPKCFTLLPSLSRLSSLNSVVFNMCRIASLSRSIVSLTIHSVAAEDIPDGSLVSM